MHSTILATRHVTFRRGSKVVLDSDCGDFTTSKVLYRHVSTALDSLEKVQEGKRGVGNFFDEAPRF
jgi:hypothetical protein